LKVAKTHSPLRVVTSEKPRDDENKFRGIVAALKMLPGVPRREVINKARILTSACAPCQTAAAAYEACRAHTLKKKGGL
jgi:hypothetical protein